MMQLGPAANVPTREQLIKLLSEPVNTVIREDLDGPNEASRLTRVAQAEKNYLYWQGKQYLVPRIDSQYGTVGYRSALSKGKKKSRVFASVYNIIYGDGIKFVSVVGQRRHNQRAVPDNAENQDQVAQAKDANAMARYLHRQWDIQRKSAVMAFHLWTTGPAFLYTHYVTNPLKYGYSQEPVIDLVDSVDPEGFRCPECGEKSPGIQCQNCGAPLLMTTYEPSSVTQVPQITGMQSYPNGAVELDVLSVMHVSVPFTARDIDDDVDWLSYLGAFPKYRVLATYEGKIDKDQIEKAEGEDTADREAMDAVERTQNPDGSVRASNRDRYLVEQRWWKPEVYHAFSDSVRKRVMTAYPDGMRTVRVNGVLVDLLGEKLADYWSVCKTGTGEYIMSDPLCFTTMPVQDDINNAANMGMETLMRGVPKTIVDGALFDAVSTDDDGTNQPLIGELIRTRTATGQDISKLIGQIPAARLSDQLVPFTGGLREQSRDINGIRPELTGGGQTTQTFREALQRKNQALMQFNPPFDGMQQAISRATENGIREAARYGTGKINVAPEKENGLEESEIIDQAMLSESGWHIEAEESVPMTFAEKAERMSQIATENPQLAISLGMGHPMNAEAVHQMFGVEDFYQPGANERAKVLRVIRQLLQEQPVVQQTVQVDPMTGLQTLGTQELPSVMPEEFADKDHILFADIVRAWCNSPPGQKQKESNPQGYRNVELYGLQHDQMAMPPMPLPGQLGPGPKGPVGPEPTGPTSTGEPLPPVSEMAPQASAPAA